MAQKNKRNKNKQNEDEPAFEADEYFAYIAGYTSGGFSYGITWEETREIAKRDPQFGKELSLIDSVEPEDDEDLDRPF